MDLDLRKTKDSKSELKSSILSRSMVMVGEKKSSKRRGMNLKKSKDVKKKKVIKPAEPAFPADKTHEETTKILENLLLSSPPV